MQMAPPAATVFCDFDGTITAEDTFDAVAAAVVPQVWWPLKAVSYTPLTLPTNRKG